MGSRHRDNLYIGDLELSVWYEVFQNTHSFTDSINRIEWPDGECFLSQEGLLIEMFSIIKSEIITIHHENAKK